MCPTAGLPVCFIAGLFLRLLAIKLFALNSFLDIIASEQNFLGRFAESSLLNPDPARAEFFIAHKADPFLQMCSHVSSIGIPGCKGLYKPICFFVDQVSALPSTLDTIH